MCPRFLYAMETSADLKFIMVMVEAISKLLSVLKQGLLHYDTEKAN